MEVSFSQLKEKEIVNVFDGKKLGRVIDVVFENSTGVVRGIVVPGERKLFRKNEDIFVPLEKLKKIGDDVILVSLQVSGMPDYRVAQSQMQVQNFNPYNQRFENERRMIRPQAVPKSYVRYKRIDNKKYK